MSKPTPGNASEQADQATVKDLALWSFLDQLKTQLRTIREDRKALRFCLRLTCEYFQVHEGCFAILCPDGSAAEAVPLVPNDYHGSSQPSWTLMGGAGPEKPKRVRAARCAGASQDSENNFRIDRSYGLAADRRGAGADRS